MPDDNYDFIDRGSSRSRAHTAYRNNISVGVVPVLRFSSPWPWLGAITISLLLWAGIAALIWRLS